MKITVKLFGRLRKHIPDYDSDNGVEIELPDGGSANDLLSSVPLIGCSGRPHSNPTGSGRIGQLFSSSTGAQGR